MISQRPNGAAHGPMLHLRIIATGARLIAAGVLVSSVLGQTFPHPTVAPKNTGVNLDGRRSAYFNEPDGIWNFGEGFPFVPLAEEGGVLGVPSGLPSIQPQDYVETRTWTPVPGFGAQNYKGYLYPANAAQPPVNEAAFEIAVPSDWLIGGGFEPRPIVLVIATHATFDYPSTRWLHGATEAYPYPGYPDDPMDQGLIHAHWPGLARVAHTSSSSGQPSYPYWLVGASITPRVAYRPLVWSLQRNVQLVEIVKQILARDFNANIDAVLIAGSSFGQGTAETAVILYPNVFHASVGFSFPPSFRRGIQDHETYVFAGSLGGHDGVSSYTPLDALDWNMALSQNGTNASHISLPARFRYHEVGGSGALQRPMYVILGDEDVTVHGDDTIPIISGTSGTVPPYGIRQVQNADPTVKLYWTIFDKRDHEEIRDLDYQLPDGTTITQDDIFPILLYMIPIAIGASAAPVTPVLPILPSVPLTTQDPYDHAFYQHVAADQPASGLYPNYLTPPPSSTWPTPGQAEWRGLGTWPGYDESIRIATPAGATKPSIYVGSADGVVSRYEHEATSGELVWRASSHEASQGTLRDLGYGAFALDVGNVYGSSDPEVVVATWRRIAILDGATLEVIVESTLPAWDHFRPKRLYIADLIAGGNPEIVFVTHGGHLVVLDSNLAIRADLFEPGIRDIAVTGGGPSVTGQSSFSVPVFALTSRGHVVALEMRDFPSQPPAILLAASPGIPGNPQDLEVTTWNGSNALVGIFLNSPNVAGAPDAIRLFDPATLNVVSSLGEIPPPPPGLPPVEPPPPPLGGTDLAIGQVNGGARYVVLNDDWLYVYGGGGLELGRKNLKSYAPAAGAIGLACGDIDGNPTKDEVVVSTRSGHLVWFRFAELTAAGEDFAIIRSTGSERTNRSLSATWGMTYADGALQVVDQTATQWAVDPGTGTATFRWEFRDPWSELPPASRGLPEAPIRSLVHVDIDEIDPADPLSAWINQAAGQLRVVKEAWTRYDFRPLLGFLWFRTRYPLLSYDGYMLLQGAGHAITLPASGTNRRRYFSWWNTVPEVKVEILPGLTYSLTISHNVILGGEIHEGSTGLWNVRSTWDSAGDAPPLLYDLRNDQRAPRVRAIEGMQSLRLGQIFSTNQPQIVTGTPGGSVQVIDWLSNAPLRESPDFGWGGMALALADLDSDGLDEVVFGTLSQPTTSDGQAMGGTIQILDWNDTPGPPTVALGPQAISDALGGRVYGVCGLAVANLDPGDTDPTPELIVGTLEGYLLVYRIFQSGGSYTLSLLYRRGFPGSVGVYNGIHVGDYVINGTSTAGSDGKKEVYVAGSYGLWRLDR